MAARGLELRNYQREALRTFRTYLRKVTAFDGVADNPARSAFLDVSEGAYTPAPLLDPRMPYVCLRIPTGGGKTLLASHAIGVAARDYLRVENPMVLWLVPSNAILDQTLAALRDLDHPYRLAMAVDFGRNLSVLSLAEALSLSRPDAMGGACVIVATLQAFRVDDTTGRKVYQDAGALMDHFSGIDAVQVARLDKVEGTDRPVASLCNVLQLHRPMVIVDEAHNARTALSYETLKRFTPSLILELTATPQLARNAAIDVVPSNVLYHVSAAELKAEEMIKLPIRLSTDTDWRKVVAQALDCQKALEEAAEANRRETTEYIRPIILFQAQSKSKTDPDRLTPDRIVQLLTDDKRIPREQIAIQATGYAELDDIKDIRSPDCPVRYVITVQKLREGWDCPFAYILCSVAEANSPTAVEQILGRVLRMPNARRKSRDILNRAYAFVASGSFQAVAERLKDGLVEGAGFSRLEAAELVKANAGFDFAEDAADFVHHSDVLPEALGAAAETIDAAIERLPPALRIRVQFDPARRQIEVTRALSREDRNHMQLAFVKVEGAETIIDRLFMRSNRIQASEVQKEEKRPFIVPRLCIRKQGELELFTQDHFLDLPWDLAACDPTPFAKRFNIRGDTKTGEIDVSDQGQIKIAFAGQVQDQLAMTIQEPAWELPRLVNWIDRGIPHPDVTKPAARVFIYAALQALIDAKGYSVHDLARYKYELRRALTDEVQILRERHEEGSYKSLFAVNAQDFETSSDVALLLDEQTYAYNQPYRGSRTFSKHYFPIIGDLKPSGEEFDCAVFLDEMPAVLYWVRNIPRKPNAFWLQLPSNRFYPDFVALLTDGRVLVVEYKGKHLEDDAKDKRIIGKLWADASGGQCLFAMPVDRAFEEIKNSIMMH